MGNDIPRATVLSLATGVAYLAHDNVDFRLVSTLLLGSIPGVLIESRVSPWLSGRLLKVILAVMLVFLGFRILVA